MYSVQKEKESHSQSNENWHEMLKAGEDTLFDLLLEQVIHSG